MGGSPGDVGEVTEELENEQVIASRLMYSRISTLGRDHSPGKPRYSFHRRMNVPQGQ